MCIAMLVCLKNIIISLLQHKIRTLNSIKVEQKVIIRDAQLSIMNEGMEVEKARNDEVRCRICGHQEFPLKRFKKNEWYHITCLMLTDMGSKFLFGHVLIHF